MVAKGRRGLIIKKPKRQDRAGESIQDILATDDDATAAKALTDLAVPVPGRLRKFWLVEDVARFRRRLGLSGRM